MPFLTILATINRNILLALKNVIDNFNRANTTDTLGSAPGQAWKIWRGGWRINSNKAEMTTAASGYPMVTKYDIFYTEDEEGNSQFSLPEHLIGQGIKPISMHPFEQIRGIQLNGMYKEYAFKWSNPYVVITPEGYSCLYTHPMNQFLPFHTLSGVVDTDTYPLAVQYPFLMMKGFSGVIPAGTPVMQIIPFKRDEWKMNDKPNTTSEEQEINRKGLTKFDQSRFDENGNIVGGRYKKRHRVKKRYS